MVVFDCFLVLRCLALFVVSKQVSYDLRRFSHDFDQEWVFCKRRFCIGIWLRKSPLSGFQLFVAFFHVFTCVSFFSLFDHFGRLLASFERLKEFWHDFWEQIVWNTIFFVFNHENHLNKVLGFFHSFLTFI